jgi:hypothetical protein
MIAARREILCGLVYAVSCLQAVAADPPRPQFRTVHRQVSRLPLTRDYRSVPVGDAATAAAHEKITAALTRVSDADMSFNETPLREVVARFCEILEVPVVLDMTALENAGIDPETPITIMSQGTTARAVLRRILGDRDLTWHIHDEALVITTRERAGENLETRLYPLPWGSVTQVAIDFQSLIDVVHKTVAPQTWDVAGGPGAIQPFGDGTGAVLAVAQTADVHDEIEGLLRGLHELGLAEFGGSHDTPAAKAPTVRVYHVTEEAVRRDLAAKLVELCNTSLPHGADAAAKVTVVGECLAVQSLTPEFHAMAGQLIRSVAGEEVSDLGRTSYPAVEPIGKPN